MRRISDLIRNKPSVGDNDGRSHWNAGNGEPGVCRHHLVSADAKVFDVHEEQHKDPKGSKVTENTCLGSNQSVQICLLVISSEENTCTILNWAVLLFAVLLTANQNKSQTYLTYYDQVEAFIIQS